MRVLVVAFAVWLGSGTVGAIGGGLLLLGLEALLAGPEAQALASEDGLALCGSLFAVPLAVALLWREAPRPGSAAREYLGLKWPGLRQGLGWGVLLLAADYGYRFLILGLGMPLSNDDRYLKIGSIPLFLPLTFVALAVLTPIFEEFALSRVPPGRSAPFPAWRGRRHPDHRLPLGLDALGPPPCARWDSF